MTTCKHVQVVAPPTGKHLRVCSDCGASLVECDLCDAKIPVGTNVFKMGWTQKGTYEGEHFLLINVCPAHAK